MEIRYVAPDGVRDVIESLGRTEDVRFSPSNRRLAIAAFRLNAIAVFDIDIINSGAAKKVALTRVVQFSSSCLNYPHGLDFIDDDNIVVASRSGDIPIFRLPSGEVADQPCELLPIQVLRASELPLLKAPGSISVIRADRHPYGFLVCNSGGSTVTRHSVDCSAGCSIENNGILLEKWLDIPDGVSVSKDRQWIAISNHNAHNVMLYRSSSSLNQDADPDGILRSVYYPHGLRFSSDGRHMFVADAGAPYVHVYANDGNGWQGVRNPVASFRVMDDSVFLRGRNNPREGGPKGIDVDDGMNVLVSTCECQPLAFFDLPAILESASAGSRPQRSNSVAADGTREESGAGIDDDLHGNSRHEQQVFAVRYELDALERTNRCQLRAVQAEARAAEAQAKAATAQAKAATAETKAARAEARAAKAKAKAARAKARNGFVINGKPWRITAPLSRIYSALRR